MTARKIPSAAQWSEAASTASAIASAYLALNPDGSYGITTSRGEASGALRLNLDGSLGVDPSRIDHEVRVVAAPSNRILIYA